MVVAAAAVHRIPLVQRHAASPDGATKPKQDKMNKAATKQKEEEQPQIQDADERLLTDVHGQATAAVDKIVCVTLISATSCYNYVITVGYLSCQN